MATVGEAYVKIIPDASGFSSSLKNEVDGALKSIDKSVQDTTDGIEEGFDKAAKESGKAMKSVGDQLKEVGKTLAAAFVTKQIAGFARDSIKAASDLNESINAVQVTFGKASAGILKFGESASSAVGMSNKDFNGFAVSFAGFTKQIAGANGDIVKVTTDLTTRIADFASVMNLDIPQAAQIFQSSLAGETESIRRFGIDLSAAAVETYALANGLINSKNEMTASIQVQARYGLLMQETAKTAGDFANTSDSLANRQRILSAEFENIKARIGAGLMPVMEGLAGVASMVLENFAKLPPGVQQVTSTIAISTGITAGLSRALQGMGVSAGLAKGAMGLLNVVLIAFTLNAQRNASEAARASRAMDELTRASDDQARAALANVVATRAFTGESMKASDIIADLARKSVGTAQRLVELGVAQDVLGISTSDAQAAIREEISAIQQQNSDLEKGAALTNSAATATGNYAGAQGDAAGQVGGLNEKLKEQEERLQNAMEAAISSFNTEIRVEQAKRKTNDAIAKYNELVKSMETGTYRGSDAFRDLAESSEEVYQSALDQAAGMAQLAVEQMVAGGATEDSIDKNALFKEALRQVALTLAPGSPLRKQLFDYINQLNNIPQNIRTQVTTVYTTEGQQYVVSPYGAMPTGNTKPGSPAASKPPSSTSSGSPIQQLGAINKLKKMAIGGMVNTPQIAMIGEAGPEVVIPLSRRARAMELMRESGLDAMVASRATVNIQSAVFNNGTDANIVAQKVNAAERARSFST